MFILRETIKEKLNMKGRFLPILCLNFAFILPIFSFRIKNLQSVRKEIVEHKQPLKYIWNFRAGSTFPVPVCTVPSSMERTSRCNKVDTVRFYASYRLNLLLLQGVEVREDKLLWVELLRFLWNENIKGV